MTEEVTELIAVDVGGTHVRFARAVIGDGTIALAEPVTLETGDHPGLESAWHAFARIDGGALPRAAAIAIAGPVHGDTVPMTNSPWVLHIAAFQRDTGVEAITVINDFGAVAHAVAHAPADQFEHVCGPDQPLPDHGTVSVIGPGTGLGVAHFHRFPGGYRVQSTEGGHIGFAPQDELDDSILAALRAQYGRVVTERVNAGPGIVPIYHALGGDAFGDDRTIWQHGLAGTDDVAVLAVERFCASLGATAGDYALAHGASAVVLAGGLGLKLREVLPRSAFGQRFCAKPRYEAMMSRIPVKQIVHPQPGLYGAAAAFAHEHQVIPAARLQLVFAEIADAVEMGAEVFAMLEDAPADVAVPDDGSVARRIFGTCPDRNTKVIGLLRNALRHRVVFPFPAAKRHSARTTRRGHGRYIAWRTRSHGSPIGVSGVSCVVTEIPFHSSVRALTRLRRSITLVCRFTQESGEM